MKSRWGSPFISILIVCSWTHCLPRSAGRVNMLFPSRVDAPIVPNDPKKHRDDAVGECTLPETSSWLRGRPWPQKDVPLQRGSWLDSMFGKKSRHVCLFKMTPEPVMLREANPSDAGDPHPRSGVWCLFWTGCGGCFHTGRAWERRPPWQIRLHHSRKTRLILKRFPPNPWDSHHKTGNPEPSKPPADPGELGGGFVWFEC